MTLVLPLPQHERDCCQVEKEREAKVRSGQRGVCFYPSGLRQLQATRRQSEELVSLGTPSKVKSQVQYCSDLVQMCGIPISKKSNMTLRLTEWNSESGGRENYLNVNRQREEWHKSLFYFFFNMTYSVCHLYYKKENTAAANEYFF